LRRGYGRSFASTAAGFTQDRFKKPFDEKMRDLMAVAATSVLDGMDGLYAYSFSDEISVVFAPDREAFDRRLEKIVSVAARQAYQNFYMPSTRPMGFRVPSLSKNGLPPPAAACRRFLFFPPPTAIIQPWTQASN
jgi:tRNA(His) 5'-end guanylyltransferase